MYAVNYLHYGIYSSACGIIYLLNNRVVLFMGLCNPRFIMVRLSGGFINIKFNEK